MEDQKLKEAILAIAKDSTRNLENHLSLLNFLAKRMPGLSQDERAALLKTVDDDKKRSELLSEILRLLG